MLQLKNINATINSMNKRQKIILGFIAQNPGTNNSSIQEYLTKEYQDVSRFTIIRDLNFLLEQGLIKKTGQGRNIEYKQSIENNLLKYFDIEEYFKKELDQRKIAYKSFNFGIFENLKKLFTEQKIKELKKTNDKYLANVKKLSKTALKKEFERLTIELSWKSSKIEGNTYSLIDTEILIKENKEARGKKKEEAIMILNHKRALEYILHNLVKFKKISIRDIEDIHKFIAQDLNIETGIRKRMVGITGTVFKPLDNQHQIREALEKTVKLLNKTVNPVVRAFLALLLITYIQPFEDGNKRTARMMANAILLANKICPISFRSIDEADYKKAVILFYEQNSARFFKELFIEQFEFAVKHYFLA